MRRTGRSNRSKRSGRLGQAGTGGAAAVAAVAVAAGALCVLGPGAVARADSAPVRATPAGDAAPTARATPTPTADATPTPTGTTDAPTGPPSSGGAPEADYAAVGFVIKGTVGQSWIEVHVPPPTMKLLQGTWDYDRTTWRVVMPPGVTALAAEDQGEAAICQALPGGRAADCQGGSAPFGTVLWVRIDKKIPGATGTVTVRPAPAVDPNPANNTAVVTTDITDAPGGTAGAGGSPSGGTSSGGTAGSGGASSGGTSSGATSSGGATAAGGAGSGTTTPAGGSGTLAATGAGGVPMAAGGAALALAAGVAATAAARRRRRGTA